MEKQSFSLIKHFKRIRIVFPISQCMDSNESPICPESTIEDANIRNAIMSASRKTQEHSAKKDGKKLGCESALESSERRGFIRKADLATAVGIGGNVLGGLWE